MDTLKKLLQLSQKAKQQEVPIFFVADHVMNQIGPKQNSVTNFFAFDMFAIGSAVAACALLFLGIQSWFYITSPLARLYAPFSGISLW